MRMAKDIFRILSSSVYKLDDVELLKEEMKENI